MEKILAKDKCVNKEKINKSVGNKQVKGFKSVEKLNDLCNRFRKCAPDLLWETFY